MFKVGGIYKFEDLHSALEKGFRSHEIREYVTRDGVRYPDILIDEECKTTKISEEGYYKVLEILGEREIRDGLGSVERYDMALRLEKVADLDWLRGHPPEPFFRALERMGLYVEHREIEKFRENVKETEWFAVDTERGILAEAETMDSKLNFVRVTLIHPARQTLRRIAFQSLKDSRMYSSHEEKFPSYWNVSASFYSFGPDIFDIIEQHEMLPVELAPPHLERFHMPFVTYSRYEGPFVHWVPPFPVGGTWVADDYPFSQEEYMAYFQKCRGIFDAFPAEVQTFLKTRTDVAYRYLDGEPWKRFENKPKEQAPADYDITTARLSAGQDAAFKSFREVRLRDMIEFGKQYDDPTKFLSPTEPSDKPPF